MVKKDFDELAYGMENVLADEGYQKIFAKPKLASPNREVKPMAKLASHSVFATLDALVVLSENLDEFGFSKSAEKLLKAAHSIEEEFHSSKEPSGDGTELDDLLRALSDEKQPGGPWDVDKDLSKDLPEDLGDSNDVMDKPSEDDKEEGNPEC